MREIKFRAWDEAKKAHWEPRPQGMVHFDIRNVPDFIGHTHNEKGRWERRFTIMQYTGLKDCNGVEIYEGDIVSVQYDVEDKTIHAVEWGGKSYPAFELMPQLNCECNGFALYCEDPDTAMEVIGNIHENPELLESAKC